MMPYVPPPTTAAVIAEKKKSVSSTSEPHPSLKNKMPPLTPNGIFHWSIENSDADHLKKEAEMLETHTPEEIERITNDRLKKLDPELVEFILGKDDAVSMKEFTQKIIDSDASFDERYAACEGLQMMAEQIDNASNLGPMGMWDLLFPLLDDANGDSSIRMMVLWIAATACQNNPKGQDFLGDNKEAVKKSLHILQGDKSSSVRHKSVLLLSSLIKNNTKRWIEFLEFDGAKILSKEYSNSISSSDDNMKNRIIFLLLSLHSEHGIDVLKKEFPYEMVSYLETELKNIN